MTGPTQFNSATYPIVRLENDWNEACKHAFEKSWDFLCRVNGSYYEAIQGGGATGAGTIAFGGASNAGAVDGTDPSAVIEAAWANMASGGRLHVKGAIDLGNTPLVLNMTKYVKTLILSGAGETGTVFTYTGTGPAITIGKSGAGGYFVFEAKDFTINCDAVTAGRNGLLIKDVGRSGVLNHISVFNADTAFDFDTNEVNVISAYDLNAVVCNTGILAGVSSTVNELAFYHPRIVDSVNYGMRLWGSSTITVHDGSIASATGIGIKVNGTLGTVLDGIHFEVVAGTCDVEVTGDNGNFPAESTLITGCYFNSPVPYAIKIGHVKGLTIQNMNCRNHTTAPIYWGDNAATDITIINPVYKESYLFDSPALTQFLSRAPGIIIDKQGIHLICTAGEANILYKSVVALSYSTGLAFLADDAWNPRTLYPVTYAPSADAKPLAVLTHGFTIVKTTGAVVAGDTLVASATEGSVKADNAVTTPKLILGYAVENTDVNEWRMLKT